MSVTLLFSPAISSVWGKVEPFEPSSQWKISIGSFYFDVARDEEERPRLHPRLVKRGKFLRAEHHFLRHEMLAKNLLVLNGGTLDRFPDHSLAFEVIRENFALQELIVRENHPACGFFHAERALDERVTVSVGNRQRPAELRNVDRFGGRKAPRLIGALRHGQ